MIKLYTLAVGETARNFFIERIKQQQIQKGYGPGEQLLVLPTNELMKKARKEGVYCVGLDYLASTLLNSLNFFKREYVQLNRASQELLVQRILEEKKEEGEPFAYFESIIKKQGFIKAFTSLIGQLRRNNVTPEELETAFEIWQEEAQPGNAEKNFDVVYVYRRYEELLIENKWYDLEGKYALVVYYLEQEMLKKLPWKAIYISDFNALEPMQLLFLQKLSQYMEVHVGLNYEYPREKMYRAVDMTYSALAQQVEALAPVIKRAPLLQYLVENLWRYKPVSSLEKALKAEAKGAAFEKLGDSEDEVERGVTVAPSIRLWQFTSREAEIRQVLTDIKAKLLANPELQPSQFCISMRKLGEYNGLSTIAEEYGIPLSLPNSLPLGQQPLIELVLGLLQGMLYNRQGWESYAQLLHNPLVKMLSRVDTERVEKLQESFYFESVNHFYQVLEYLAAQEEQKLFPAKEFLEDELLIGMKDFMAQLPEKGSVEQYGQALKELLLSWQLEERLGLAHIQRGMDLEAIKLVLEARNKLLDTLDILADNYQLCQWQDRELELAEYVEILRNSLEGHQLKLAKAFDQGVVVTPALNLQGLPCDYLYLMGLREGEFPGRNTEDWFYNDRERNRLGETGRTGNRLLKRKYYIFNKQEQNALTYDMGIEMPDTAASYAQEDFLFGMAIGQARVNLTLSWHYDDTSGASPYVDAVRKVLPNLEIKSWLSSEKLPASQAEVEAKGKACPEAQLDSLMLEASLADEKRLQGGSTYNGNLQAEDLVESIAKKKSFSASRLKVYAICPFEYLVTKVWKEQGLQLMDQFLPPNISGDVLHRVVQLLVQEYVNRPISTLGSSWEESLTVLKERLEPCLDQACRELKVDTSAYYETDRAQLLNKLLRWLDFEFIEQLSDWGFHPLATELDLNYLPMRCQASDGETIDFALTGKIDRIDVNNRGELFITDYKSSSVPSSTALSKGLDLQMPVYLLAAHQLLKRRKEEFALPTYLQRGPEAPTHAERVVGAGYLSFNSSGNHKVERFDRVEVESPKPPKYNKDGSLSKNQPKNDKVWEIWEQKFRQLLADYIQGVYRGNFSLALAKDCDAYCPLKEICRVNKLGKEEPADE